MNSLFITSEFNCLYILTTLKNVLMFFKTRPQYGLNCLFGGEPCPDVGQCSAVS